MFDASVPDSLGVCALDNSLYNPAAYTFFFLAISRIAKIFEIHIPCIGLFNHIKSSGCTLCFGVYLLTFIDQNGGHKTLQQQTIHCDFVPCKVFLFDFSSFAESALAL